MTSPVIAISGLRHAYNDRTVLALDQWSVARGQHVLVLGASGSGKTTLLHAIGGLIAPTAGIIEINGQNIAALPVAVRDRFRGRTMGMVLQTLHLVPALSVRDNLRLARRLAGCPTDDRRIAMVLERLGLTARAHMRPKHLSQGEAQRTAIARAVVTEPRLVLADEPTSALDDANCAAVASLLQEEATACDATLVIATHDQRLSDRFQNRLVLEARP